MVLVKPFNHGSMNFILRFKNLTFKTFERKGQNKSKGYYRQKQNNNRKL